MFDHEPIAACITPWGHGAVSVIRVSGGDLSGLLAPICGSLPPAQHARYVRFRDAEGLFDDGLVVSFPAPRSYTGEHVVELSCHGNPLLVERLLRAIGARPARPGEFTRRAFVNGKVDLARAEAVMQVIAATSRRGLDGARAGLDGAMSAALAALRDPLADTAAELEAILDYPGEDLLFEDDAALIARLRGVAATALALAASERPGRFAVEGARVVLAGPPNAGKSSLFNAFLGKDRAIVSATAGTTRDSIEAAWQLDGVRITLVDTAGERDATDVIEAEGVARALAARVDADLVLRCVPVHLAAGAGEMAGAVGTSVTGATAEKLNAPVGCPTELVVGTFSDLAVVNPLPLMVSARSGAGLDALRESILSALGVEDAGAGPLLASARVAALCRQVAEHAQAAADALPEAGPAAAAERIYAAIDALDEGTGAGVREEVLDRLFARFCVGK